MQRTLLAVTGTESVELQRCTNAASVDSASARIIRCKPGIVWSSECASLGDIVSYILLTYVYCS